jgi:sigma-B regulation protein RsbU (phosphoserine phosphatase)
MTTVIREPAPRSRLRAHLAAYVGLAALLTISVLQFARQAFDRLDAIGHADTYVRDPFFLGDGNWGAVNLMPEAEAAGLKFGDVVLAVDGHPVDGFFDYYGVLRNARAGDTLHIRMRSQDERKPAVHELSIALQPYAAAPANSGVRGWVGFSLLDVVLPGICVVLGFWVAGVRIEDRAAWLLLTILLGLTAFFRTGGGESAFGRGDGLELLLLAFRSFFSLALVPALMVFGVTFPEPLPLDRRYPWLRWLLTAYLLTVAALVSVDGALWVHHLDWSKPIQRAVELLTGREGNFNAGVEVLALVIGIGALAWKTNHEAVPDARRRLVLLDCGAVTAMAALLIVIIPSRFEIGLPGWAALPVIAMVLAFPISMAYVIVVHRAMDVRVVIRQGLQYLLATNGVRLLQAAVSIGIILAAAMMNATTGAVRVVVIAAGFGVLAGIRGFARRLQRWIDRRFFREAYETDAILSDLAATARTIVDTSRLLETVAQRIAAALHISRIAVLLDANGAFWPAYAVGYGTPPTSSLSPDSLAVRSLRKQAHAIVHFDDPGSWVQLTDDQERAALQELTPEILLPMTVNDQMLGVMSLGPKQSEEPFSGHDIRLLDSVAAQVGLAIENGRLTETIKAEVAAREKQKRELEIASEVQERLFPQDYSPMPGIEYAGRCRPALSVGGDYYDFIPVSAEELGIAIGDVSGKGIPAALLMATLRAYLRGQILNRQVDLTVVMANLSRLVFESSAANRYATFFYAELDSATRTLDYVNAGHNPPLVFRRRDGASEVLRLDVGGMVIGLMEEYSYTQGRIVLERGDVLVAYTDGISESMNGEDQEWGEERLIEVVRANGTAGPSELIDRLMAGAAAFAAGAPQHDDMTALVIRVA